MPAFAANLSMMFTEWPLLDRFDAAADAGFAAVELLFPYELTPDAIVGRLTRNNLTQVLLNLPPGNWAAGERGLAALADRFDEFKSSVDRALIYAKATRVQRVHVLAGLADRRNSHSQSSYRRAILYTAEILARHQLDLLLKPINGRNMPGYFLNDFGYAETLITDLGLPSEIAIRYHHRQIMHGDVAMALRRLLPMIGHIQIASVPSGHEPDGEELNYPFLFSELDRLPYNGFVGCEYLPRGHTLAGLSWFEPYKRPPTRRDQ
jgi:hydroxypyruvate isomerase